MSRALLIGMVAGAFLGGASPALGAGDGWHAWTGVAGDVAEHGIVNRHEAIWNDELFDDYGANVDGFESMGPDPFLLATGPHVNPSDPTRPSIAPSGQVGRFRHTGDFSYPPDAPNPDPVGDPLHENHTYTNVADFAEVRLAVERGMVFLRFSLTGMRKADATVFGVALETGPTAGPGGAWPYGARLHSGGWDHFLTVWGTGGAVTTPDGKSRSLASVGGAIRVDTDANTVDVRVPRDAVVASGDAGRWRLVAGAGMWDAAAAQWAEPPITETQSTSPGALGLAPRVFDLAFNQAEPNSLWHETRQANDLVAQTVDSDGWTVDLRQLAARRGTTIPCTPGPRVETFSSQLGGARTWRTDEGMVSLPQDAHSINYVYRWHVEPIAFVLPPSACSPSMSAPSMDYLFHPANANHNTWAVGIEGAYEKRLYVKDPPSGYGYVSELARRYNRITASGMGKGEGWNYGDAAGEEQADDDAFVAAAKRYRHDPDRVRALGMSGRLGAPLFTETWPDRISHIVTVSNHDADVTRLVNLRNTPWVFMHGDAGLDYDATATGGSYQTLDDKLTALGYQFAHLTWHGRGHDFTMLDRSYRIADAWTRAPRIHPARISYVIDPAVSRPNHGIPLFPGVDWIRGAALADAKAAGTIDLTTLALADRLPIRKTTFTGRFLNLGTGDLLDIDGISYDDSEAVRARMPDAAEPGWEALSVSIASKPTARPGVANALSGKLTGISALTIDVRRAGLDPRRPIDVSGVTTTKPVAIKLRVRGATRTATIQPG
ncbi:MAG: hypothetical protein QOI98_1952 [Solirubrobacteraceae bacterium]|nr:hypothetical protein [Solirubrobacteraceae bacterium]